MVITTVSPVKHSVSRGNEVLQPQIIDLTCCLITALFFILNFRVTCPVSKRKPTSPLAYYCAFWIDHLCTAAALPQTTANALMRTAIHAAPPLARPTPIEGWMFEQATDHADILNCEDCMGWLRMRAMAGDDRAGSGPVLVSAVGRPSPLRHDALAAVVPGSGPGC